MIDAVKNFRLTKAIEAIDAYPGPGDERDQLVRAKCRGLMRGYDARWADAGYETIEAEKIYTADLINPETGKQSRTFSIAGKIDALVSMHGRTFLMDHKTTSDDIADPDSPYWRQLAIEGQVSHYLLLLMSVGIKPDGAIWDVIRKPTISPKKLTKAERASAVSERRYFGSSLTMDTLNALQLDDRETFEMYEARLAHDCTTERPERYFQRKPVPRLDADIMEYWQDLWEQGQLIMASRARQRLGKRIPKHSGSCMLYNSPCKFLGICSNYDSPDSDKWQRKPMAHRELPGVAGDVLTNSRLRCSQTCPTKHYYEYELGIERVDEEEKESLFMGSCLHAGLEAWMLTFKLENDNHVNSENSSSASGVEQQSATTQLPV